MRKLALLFLCVPFIGWSHGVPESTIIAMTDASLLDFIYFLACPNNNRHRYRRIKRPNLRGIT